MLSFFRCFIYRLCVQIKYESIFTAAVKSWDAFESLEGERCVDVYGTTVVILVFIYDRDLVVLVFGVLHCAADGCARLVFFSTTLLVGSFLIRHVDIDTVCSYKIDIRKRNSSMYYYLKTLSSILYLE